MENLEQIKLIYFIKCTSPYNIDVDKMPGILGYGEVANSRPSAHSAGLECWKGLDLEDRRTNFPEAQRHSKELDLALR